MFIGFVLILSFYASLAKQNYSSAQIIFITTNQRSNFTDFFTSLALVRKEVCSLKMVELPKHVAAD
jgi:hypothetical protein